MGFEHRLFAVYCYKHGPPTYLLCTVTKHGLSTYLLCTVGFSISYLLRTVTNMGLQPICYVPLPNMGFQHKLFSTYCYQTWVSNLFAMYRYQTWVSNLFTVYTRPCCKLLRNQRSDYKHCFSFSLNERRQETRL